jgi:anti-sigma factor RsiW
MHRLVRDRLEEVLAEPNLDSTASHLRECEECRSELAAIREQSAALRQLRTPEADVEPRAGFYARVMERIESQGPGSIWTLFFDSPFGRRIAFASMALALLLGLYLVTSEQAVEPFNATREPVQLMIGEDQPGVVLTNQGTPDRDSVLLNLATYQEQ